MTAGYFCRFAAAALLFTWLCTGCGSSSAPEFSSDTIQSMKQIVEKHRFTYSLPGVIVGVWIPGQGEWVYASGIADTATGRLTASENKMRIASITKTYTATVVLQLIQEGKLTLDTTLDNFAPYVPRANRITVRHLLNHTSGIDTYSGGTFTTTLLNNPKTVWTPRQLIDLGISLPPTNEPGAMHSYSNTNYVLLGVIIEQLTGNSVEDEVQRRILTRLNLSSSSFPKTGVTALAAPFSHGYWPQGGGVLLDITELDPSSHWTSGGIVANVADLRAWGEALAKGTLLSAQMQNDRLTWVQNPHDAHKFYGLGIMRYGEFLGHDGTMPGYESLVYHLPSRNATIVVLTNGMRGAILSSPTEEIFKEIVNLLMPEAKAW